MSETDKPNNVIKFPGTYKGEVLPDPQEVKETHKEIVNATIEELSEELTDMTLDMFAHYGLDFDVAVRPDLNKDVGLLSETIKSVVYKFYRHEHQLQNVANAIFEDLGGGAVRYRGQILVAEQLPPTPEDK